MFFAFSNFYYFWLFKLNYLNNYVILHFSGRISDRQINNEGRKLQTLVLRLIQLHTRDILVSIFGKIRRSQCRRSNSQWPLQSLPRRIQRKMDNPNRRIQLSDTQHRPLVLAACVVLCEPSNRRLSILSGRKHHRLPHDIWIQKGNQNCVQSNQQSRKIQGYNDFTDICPYAFRGRGVE